MFTRTMHRRLLSAAHSWRLAAGAWHLAPLPCRRFSFRLATALASARRRSFVLNAADRSTLT